jgi:hypothetical protein
VDISFSHKPTHFPAFLSYLSTNILDFNGKAMLKGTSVEDRDLSDFLVDAKWDKKNLLVKGITRDLPSGTQRLTFEPQLKKNLVVSDASAIFPSRRYLLQSGEIMCRNGRFHVNLKLQMRVKFGIFSCLISRS